MRRTRLFLMLSAAFILISVMPVLAGPPEASLHGTYSVTGTSTCIQTDYGLAGDPAPYGFDDSFTLLIQGNVRTRYIKSVLVLRRDGTGTWHERLMMINHPYMNPGQKPMTVWEGDCSVSNGYAGEGTFELTLNDCEGTNTAGAGFPGTSGVESMSLSVTASGSGDILLLSGTEPRVERLWNVVPGSAPSEAERICARSLTAVRTR